MNEPTLHRGNFLLHLKERPGHDGPVLLKEPAREPTHGSHARQLHNEYLITRQLADVAGVRPALAKEGTESRPVLILEYVQGHSLAELIRAASLDLAEKLRLVRNVARALGHVHDHQIMHKEVSSSNILVADGDAPGSQGGAYIIDFGLASTTGKESPSLLAADDALMGALAYVSPEQTGRMNRQVDSRTDLYSLGVTLYELFTGRVPFDSGDVLELIHDHIARQPSPPHRIVSGIPGPVSDIILRLLAKDADDRYQTARGLQADLERCLDQWLKTGRIEPFELGSDDFTGRLQIPQKLYGRQAEIGHLQTILNRAIAEQTQILLVAGYSGVGKTSLVREIQKDVIAKRGAFIEGKFDQLQQTLPYSAWAQALTQLVNIWLTQGETSIAGRRESILEAVGAQGQVLIDLIPALELIIGPQPDVPQLDGVENQYRINYFFKRFIACLATPEHPLVVFLDDLQWIDSASLTLIETLLTDRSGNSVLVIGAYRSNEVGESHPLAISQNRMRTETDRVAVLTLGDLSPDDTNLLLADSLRIGVNECGDLGRILVEKSAGNPFFFRQLLVALEADGLVEFNYEQRRWIWDDALDQSIQARGSVVDLMIARIRVLPADTRRALSLAACIGSRFDMTTLHAIVGQPQSDVVTSLEPALRAGLIVHSNRYLSFAHDRIQEAGYALFPAPDRPRIHLEIGRSLLAAIKTAMLGEEIFAVVGHLNTGRALIEKGSDRLELAALNLRAGQKARAASAFADAKRHIEIGLELLGQASWQDHYDLILSLHSENAELALITGQTNDVSTNTEAILANARNTADQIRAYKAQIDNELSRSETVNAFRIGIGVLEKLGVRIPEKPDPGNIRRLNSELLDRMTGTPEDAVAALPVMTDERALAASAILAAISPASYIIDPSLVPIVNYQAALLTAELGYNTWSASFFARLALVAFAAVRHDSPDHELRGSLVLAKQMQALAQELSKKPESAPSRTMVLQILALIAHWSEPIDRALEISQATFESRVETGDLLHGVYGCLHFANHGMAAGLDLDAYRRRVADYVQFCDSWDQRGVAVWLSIFLQTAQRLEETSPEPHRLVGTYFNEDDWLPEAEAAGDIPGRHWFFELRLLLVYHFDVDNEFDECVSKAEEFLGGGVGMVSYAVVYFYSALTRLRFAGRLNEKDRTDAFQLVDRSLRLMRFWSESTPSTFQHKYELIAAERARVIEDLEGAISHYERAIDGARASGFTHEEALANELYARFWVDLGHDRYAGPLMREAHILYLKWGARAKVEHLATCYPNLVTGKSVHDDQPGTQTVSDRVPGELDLRTVLKVSQDIASEIDLDGLLARLMTDVIENTGAQRGFLVLERDGRLMIEARASVEEPDLYSRANEEVAGTDVLAEGVVNYVASTHETVVLEDAIKSGRFVHHHYVQAHQARSILCTPLINQGKISAILYLENNLASNVFSTQRVSLLKLLSAQMAISIDNARTHADLERLLELRSKALASAEAQVHTLFEDSPLGIALSSPEGRLLSANKAVVKMLRITKKELFERSVIDFYDDPHDRDALLRRVKESGFVQDFGVQLVRHDGSRFHASLNMSKLALEGNEVLLAMVQDVTAQITAEQETAVLEERARLSRELHDAVSQTILSANLLADAMIRTAEEGREMATRDLTKLRDMLRGAQDEMRTLLLELRPATVRQQTLGQLLPPIVEAARARWDAQVNLHVEGDRLLPMNVTTHLLRITQESLSNATRHAEATTIEVDLACGPDGVVLRISDDGRGFDVQEASTGHHGLGIMRERAHVIGAVLEVHSTINGGTEVSAVWS